MSKNFPFDVALSFAGADRRYVEQVATLLKAAGIKVHYDQFSQVDAWGKDLPEHFDDIYRNQARYCVMFISEHYVKKVWPSFEKRSALAREVVEQGYILPVRFDNTDVLGMPPSKAYIDLRQHTPEQLAQFIIEKLGKESRGVPLSQPTFRRPKVAKSFDPYKESPVWVDYLVKELEKRCESSDISFSALPREGRRCLRFVVNGEPIYSIDINLSGLYNDHGLSFSYAHGAMRLTSGYNATADFAWDTDKECVVLKLNEFSSFSRPSNEEQGLTKDEFVDHMWEKVCDVIDEKR
jgi:hypothetical protein